MKYLSLKLISLILALITVLTVFASCTSEEDPDASDSNDATEQQTEFQPIDGVLTLFAAGDYRAKVIRGETASSEEREVYNQIKDLIKKRTGVSPSIATDFVAAGQELYDGPAILIGETDYDESKAAYRKLGEGEATATFTGNKYVIAFSTKDSVESLITALKNNLNKKGSKTEINIDSAWNINIKLQYHTSGTDKFDPTGIKSKADLPSDLGTKYDAGQGSYTYLKTNATKSDFESRCKEAEANGFKKYTTNQIGNNEFATYVTDTQILHFMFFPNKNELRTAIDKRGSGTAGFTLPGLSGDNRYTKTEESLMTLVEIENSSWPGGMCLIFKLCDGRFVIIDSGVGGRDNDGSSSGWVYATLARHAEDPKNIQVAAWIITHVHSDHAGGLVDMARGTYEVSRPSEGQNRTHNVMPRECKQWIKIDTLIYNRPANNVDGRNGWMDEIVNAFKVKNVIKAHPGQVFYYANCKFTMYGSLDLVIDKKISNHNDESLSMMFEFNDKKFLVLGDAYPQNTTALATIYKESLKADIVQTSHHGYNNTAADQVYKYVQATMVIWPVASYEMRDCDLKNDPMNAIFKETVPDNMQFAPHGGNIDFDEKWKASGTYRVYSAIPYCDCSWCKTQPNSNKSKSSNF